MMSGKERASWNDADFMLATLLVWPHFAFGLSYIKINFNQHRYI